MPSEIKPLPRRQFASDNYAGICPEAFAALTEANQGHAQGYGDDPWTASAADMIRGVFETDAQVYFVFNGTSANSLALASLCQSYHSVLCHEFAHIETDECGAPEFFSNGTKLLVMPGAQGKLQPGTIRELALKRQDIHFPKPRVLSLTQATEMGTIYSLDELSAIRETAKEVGLAIHMDGARFANAVAEMKVAPKEIIKAGGVDVLCFGGIKNGLAAGEAVVFFNSALANEFDYRCKQAGQLASKMRFMAAPWVGILRENAWLKHATHANEMAKQLERGLRSIPGIEVLYPRQANAVFIRAKEKVLAALREKGWIFYDFIGSGARLMCAWDTTSADVEAFVRDVKALH